MSSNTPSPASRIARSKSDLPALVADDIRDQIIRRLLVPGSKLPTERELGEEHGVSRVVVREAIARLRHEGLVTSHQGRGVFVAAPEDGRFLSISEAALSQPEDYRKLYDLRKILESGTAALAAAHRDEHDLRQMEAALARMSSADIVPETYVEADIAFHKAISSASKNAFLVLFVSFVDSRLKESIAFALAQLDFLPTVEVSRQEHSRILESIRSGDAEGARLAMLTHLENSSRRLGI